MRAAAYTGQIATAVNYPNTLAGNTIPYAMSRSRHKACQAISTATKMQIGYPTWAAVLGAHGATETYIGSSLTYTAAIEYPSGTIIGVVTYNGSTSAVFPASSGIPLSDAITLSTTIPSGAYFFCRMHLHSTASSNCWPYIAGAAAGANGSVIDTANGECFAFGGTDPGDLTQTGGTFTGQYVSTPTSIDSIIKPNLIVGSTTLPSVFLGPADSRVFGYRDYHGDTSGDLGEIARALGQANIPYANYAVTGDRLVAFASSNANRLFGARYCSHVIMQAGVNDLVTDAVSDATLRSTALQVRSYFVGTQPVFLVTMPSETSSSDNWQTQGNQTINSVFTPGTGAGVTHNTWRLSVPYGFAGCFDVASVVTPSQLWLTNGTAQYSTWEGVHETYAAALIIKNSGAVNVGALVR